MKETNLRVLGDEVQQETSITNFDVIVASNIMKVICMEIAGAKLNLQYKNPFKLTKWIKIDTNTYKYVVKAKISNGNCSADSIRLAVKKMVLPYIHSICKNIGGDISFKYETLGDEVYISIIWNTTKWYIPSKEKRFRA